MHRYQHVVGACEQDRRHIWDNAGPVIFASCHRRLRGPYTGVDTVLAAILPDACTRWPDLVDYHRYELLESMPELSDIIGPPAHNLTSEAPFAERTRWYGVAMVRCHSQGVITCLREYALRTRREGRHPIPIVFDAVQDADVTTQEFIALFIRRIGADLWPAVIGSDGDLDPILADELSMRADRIAAAPVPKAALPPGIDLAAVYIDSDGTNDDPRVRSAYEAMNPTERIAAHDRRASVLEAEPTKNVHIDALPYHRENGSDPHDAGVAALLSAAEYCATMGFAGMVAELAARGRALVDRERDPDRYRQLSNLLIAQLISFRRLDEAMAMCDELRGWSADPLIHMSAAYFLAMIYTRFTVPRDHTKAAAWENTARAIAAGLPDERQRLILSGFQENGMALIEMHRGSLHEALELVENAIRRLDEQLEPDEWMLHRSQLLYNQARLFAALRRDDEAYAVFTSLVEMDPLYSDYLSERAKISRRRGDLTAAIRDYDRAALIGPPFAELFHNRGSAYAELGEVEQALANFTFVLDMEPDDSETLLSRAELLLGQGDTDAAAVDVIRALNVAPDDLRLLCLRGIISLTDDRASDALEDFDVILAKDPDYLTALINRAVALFELGRTESAVEDFTRALALSGDDPDLLLNRGIAYAAAGNSAGAIADFDRALTLGDADIGQIRFQRGACLLHSGDQEAAEADLHAAADAGYDPDEIEPLLDLVRRPVPQG